MSVSTMAAHLIQSDARRLPLADASVDSVVTDPPAGIGFMGKTWDKPGVLGVSGGVAMPATMANRNPICLKCRKHQRGNPPRPVCECAEPEFDTAKGIRFERRQFIDFLTAALAEAYRVAKPGSRLLCWAIPRTSHWTGTAVEDAGWVIEDRISHLFGQGFPKGKSRLKPACEDWWLARKPAGKVPHLPGLDACRIGETVETWPATRARPATTNAIYTHRLAGNTETQTVATGAVPPGRWPAHVVLDEEAAEELDRVAPTDGHGGWPNRRGVGGIGTNGHSGQDGLGRRDDYGVGASRFFYVAKSDRAERNAGCRELDAKFAPTMGAGIGEREHSPDEPRAYARNFHPTVKPIALMRWLCRLITPPGGMVLDCFNGSGSTGVAAVEEGFDYIGVERDAEYLCIARARLAHATRQPLLFANAARYATPGGRPPKTAPTPHPPPTR